MERIADDRILIAGRAEAARILSSPKRRHRIAYAISIGDPGDEPPAGFRQIRHRLRLVFEDELTAELGGPARDDVESLVYFARTIDFTQGQLLVHCQAGISRSAAAAAIIMAAVLGPGHEPEVAAFLRRLYPHCRPNRLMLELAGRILNTGDALPQALAVVAEQEQEP